MNCNNQSEKLRFYIITEAPFIGSCEIFCTRLEKVESFISTDIVYIEKKRLLCDIDVVLDRLKIELHFRFDILHGFLNIHINSLPLFATKDLKSEKSILDHNSNFNDEESLEFIIDGQHYSIIKSILCAGSNYFKYLCNIQEDITSELIIKDRPEAFKKMLSFIIIDLLILQFTDYLEEWVRESHIIPDLLIVADRYDVPNLKFVCESVLVKDIAVENVSELMELATVSDTSRLKKNVTNFLKSCKEKFVYSKTFLSLRRDRRYKILKIIEESE